MRAWTTDALVSLFEGLLDLADAFLCLRARFYFTTALIVIAVTCFAAWGPSL